MIVRTAIKAGCCYAAVYYTRKEGVWGNSEDTYKLLGRMQTQMEPVCKSVRSQINYQPPPMPSSGEIGFIANHYYNQGVKATFHFVKMIPCYIGQGIKKASDALKNAQMAEAK